MGVFAKLVLRSMQSLVLGGESLEVAKRVSGCNRWSMALSLSFTSCMSLSCTDVKEERAEDNECTIFDKEVRRERMLGLATGVEGNVTLELDRGARVGWIGDEAGVDCRKFEALRAG